MDIGKQANHRNFQLQYSTVKYKDSLKLPGFMETQNQLIKKKTSNVHLILGLLNLQKVV